MNDRDPLLGPTRRHFFGRCGVGLGSMALASLLDAAGPAPTRPTGESRPAGPAPGHHSGAGEERHLPVHGRRAEPARAVRLQAGAPAATTASRSRSRSSRASGSPSWTRSPRSRRSCSATRRQFARHGESGRLGLGVPAAPGDGGRRPGVRQDRSGPSRSTTPRRSCSSTPGPPSSAGRAWAPGSTYGIGSEADDLPGFVVLQSGPRGPRGGAVLWGSGFLPTAYQGVPFRNGPEPILDLRPARGRRRGRPAGRPRRDRRPEPPPARRHRRPGDRHPDRRLRDGLPDADQRPGADRPGRRVEGDARPLRRRAGQAVVRQQLPAGPPAGRARASGSCSSTTPTGTTTAAPAENLDDSLDTVCRDDRPRLRRADHAT